VRSKLLSGIVIACFLVLIVVFLPAQMLAADAEPGVNSNPTYVALHNIRIGTEALSVNNFELRRDRGIFRFASGTFFFVAPVEGKVTGAVFVGDGRFILEPGNIAEQHSISILTKSPSVDESFEVAVFRFTDGSYDEIKKSGTSATGGDSGRAARELSDNLEMLRKDHLERYNLSARILQDVLATPASGMFYAFIQGKKFEKKELFAVDPQGVTACGIQPEEVCFATLSEMKYGIWYAGHLASEHGQATGTQENASIDVQKQVIDVEIEKSGNLHGKATTTITARRPLRVVPLNLFRNLHVQSVADAAGQSLAFAKEDLAWDDTVGDDADNFNVILPKVLAVGDSFTFTTTYGGKEAVRNEGGGNYFPVARDDWYPSPRMGDFSDFDITLRVPKGMKVAATGALVREGNENGEYVSEWRSEVPISVGGFSFGKFKTMEAKAVGGITVQSFANEQPPDWVAGLKHAAEDGAPEMSLGSMDTTSMMKKPLAEGQIAIEIYTDYFGPISFKHVALTQQMACNFGQAWPELVWLPICAYFDTTVRHQLGVDDVRQPYWNVVASHEVAHEWWGHTVGWASYRDQWMSEGFAQLSASIFVQAVYSKDPDQYLRFWKSLQEGLLWKNRFGYRPIDIGPVTMGMRLDNAKSGSAYTELIYGKGAFILHMLRRMMWDRKTGDQQFQAMMQDFLKTYHDRPASTEDFKAIAEKHMPPAVDLDGNHKLDWFFNEFVYGTELPKYDFSYDIGKDEKGGVVLSIKLKQSNVSDQFKMRVPVFVELANGKVIELGSAKVVGNTTLEQKIPVGNIDTPKKMMVNYYYDVLSGE